MGPEWVGRRAEIVEDFVQMAESVILFPQLFILFPELFLLFPQLFILFPHFLLCFLNFLKVGQVLYGSYIDFVLYNVNTSRIQLT